MGEQVSERESLAHRLHADDLAHGRAVAMWDNLIPDARRWYRDNADAALAWFAEHRGPRVADVIEDLETDIAELADWARTGHTVVFDDETETTGECVDDCPGCAAERIIAALTPTTESEDR